MANTPTKWSQLTGTPTTTARLSSKAVSGPCTAGAGIYQPLIAPLNETSGYTQVLTKGTFADAEEYSIFRNQLSAEHLHKVITVLGITQIDVCGLAGDVCVLNTLTDGVKRYGAPMFRVLTKYVSSLDGGKALSEFIAAHGIATL